MRDKLIGSAAVCLALIAGAVYFVHRYWLWLDDPGHASGIQASTTIILGCPTLAFAIFATVAAIRSAELSAKQALAADKQALAADAQSEVARCQTRLIAAQRKEQVRPVLILEKRYPELRWDHRQQVHILRNVGNGAAHNIGAWYEFLVDGQTVEHQTESIQNPFCLPAGQELAATIPQDVERSHPLLNIQAAYEDVDGGRFSSIFHPLGGEIDELHNGFADRWTSARERQAGPVE